MSKPSETLQYYLDRSWQQADMAGFHDMDWSIGDMLLLIVSEITEAFEEYRDGHASQEVYFSQGEITTVDNKGTPDKPEGLPIELADACIRIFELSKRIGVDLEGCIRIKLDYNLTRSKRHGGKRV